MGTILAPAAQNILDCVKRGEIAVLTLEGAVMHVFGDFTGGDIIIRLYRDNQPSQEYRAKDERHAASIIGAIVLEQVATWKIAS